MSYRLYDKYHDYIGQRRCWDLTNALMYMIEEEWECVVNGKTGKILCHNPWYIIEEHLDDDC